jgi:single-stranded-DNA-specific exonuclease
MSRLLRQRWAIVETDHALAEALAKEARIPVVLAELLVSRGITSPSEAYVFLNPEFSHLNDPFLMLGMAEAVERLERAIAAKEPVLLYGDYDVDGTTAVVLLKTAIEMLGGEARFHVPHRLREGYGLQSSVLETAHAEGVRLVITVDTGMRAFAEAETAQRLGLDLIITDHHLTRADDAVPKALAILNPNQAGCCYPEKSLCGAAIALKLAQAVLERRDLVRTREKTLPSFLKIASSPPWACANCAGRPALASALCSPPPPSIRLPNSLPASMWPSAWLRASTPPAAWTWPRRSSSCSRLATRAAPPNSPPSWNA